jgi:hypothetical protein
MQIRQLFHHVTKRRTLTPPISELSTGRGPHADSQQEQDSSGRRTEFQVEYGQF